MRAFGIPDMFMTVPLFVSSQQLVYSWNWYGWFS